MTSGQVSPNKQSRRSSDSSRKSQNESLSQRLKMDTSEDDHDQVEMSPNASDRALNEAVLESTSLLGWKPGKVVENIEQAAILLTAIAEEDDTMDEELQRKNTAISRLKSNASLLADLKVAWQKKTFHTISRRLRDAEANKTPYEKQQIEATVKSFSRDYAGNATDYLWEHVKHHFRLSKPEVQTSCTRYTAIIQSSGTGKSRTSTVDELSKQHFVIPVCLRNERDAMGFPPPDSKVLRYLMGRDRRGVNEEFDGCICASAFLAALFAKTGEEVKQMSEMKDVNSLSNLAAEFRKRMTDGQTVGRANDYRRNFYESVVERAKKLESEIMGKGSHGKGGENRSVASETKVTGKNNGWLPAVNLALLENSISKVRGCILTDPQAHDLDEPLVILVFDEAHTLTWKGMDDYVEMRFALRKLRSQSLFTLFLSTTCKLTQFVPPRTAGSSNRTMTGQPHLIEKFTDLGLDQLATRVSDGDCTLAEVTRVNYMLTFGRPLFKTRYEHLHDDDPMDEMLQFAAGKLINTTTIHDGIELTKIQKLACLSQRIPMRFLPSQSVPPELRERLMEAESELVASHMRLRLKINRETQSMVTAASSEPLLCEASFLLMQMPNFDAPYATRDVLRGCGIDPGLGGVFVVLLLAILARDSAVQNMRKNGALRINWTNGQDLDGIWERSIPVDKFLSELVNLSGDKDLEKAVGELKDYRVHFNHFIKVFEEDVLLNSQCLAGLMTRGAAVLCADKQERIDILIPALKPDMTQDPNTRRRYSIHSERVVAVLIQIKASKRFTANPKWEVNDSMAELLEKKNGPSPICCIVFALAAKSSGVKFEKEGDAETPKKNYLNIWCAGMSHAVLPQVSDDRLEPWTAILRRASFPWEHSFEDKDRPNIEIRETMHPGGAVVHGFHKNFYEVDKARKTLEGE